MKNFPIFLILLTLVGCMHPREMFRTPGSPNRSMEPYAIIETMENSFQMAEKIKSYYDTRKEYLESGPLSFDNKETLVGHRNEIIASQIALMDLYYQEFIISSNFRKQILDFSASMAELGLNLATTVVDGESIKTILGAASAGVTGANTEINEAFFYDKTMAALVSAMNAKRKESRIPIEEGIGRGITEYPLATALSDLNAYYYAGTFLGALEMIHKESENASKQASENIENIKIERYDKSIYRDALLKFINGRNEEAYNAIKKWLEKKNLAISPDELQNKKDHKLERKEFIEHAFKNPDSFPGLNIDSRILTEDKTKDKDDANDLDIQVVILNYIKPENDANIQKLESLISSYGLENVSLYDFLYLNRYESERVRAVKDLKIKL